MPTKSDERAKDLYQSIMVEVMIRTFSINTATRTPTTIPQALIREYCFLQLRMLCELVALGCLVAHGDITTRQHFQKVYKADEILRRLEKLHPDFFPYPFKPVFTPATPQEPVGGLQLHETDADYLKKDELIQLYAKCGSALHKGSLRRLLSIKMTPEPEPYRDISFWGQKLLNLLSAHRISRIGNRFHLIALLNLTAPNSDQATVQVAIAESPPQK
jgi:hypothetical protein